MGESKDKFGKVATVQLETEPANPAIDATFTDPGALARPSKVSSASELFPLRMVSEGEFEVVEEFARGGMGRILRARDNRHQREVALKEMIGKGSGSRTRFAREALITARLQHPGIVPVYEFATWQDGEPFYSMKLVEGRPLSEEIADADSVEKRLALLPKVIDAARAIAYAHQQGVIHRDLKPSNILVGGFGETVVIDWGLAKDLSEDEDEPAIPSDSAQSDLTVAGTVIGTPSYMPLEQAVGETLDERADVYALGAILYHLALGEPPFRAKSGDAVLALVRDHAPTPLADLQVEVPSDLVTIIDKAMARNRDDRYANAAPLARELERFTTGQLVGAHRYSIGELLRRRLRRHRGVVAAIAVAAVALVVVSAVAVSQILAERNEARKARNDAEAARAEADTQRELADSQRGRAEGLVDFMIADLSEKLGPSGQVGLLKDVATRAHAYAATGDPEALPTLERKRRVASLLGNIRRGEGDIARAETSFREELVFANRVAAVEHSAEAKLRVAAAHRRVAAALADQGQREAAIEELERSKVLLVELKEVDVVMDAVNTELRAVMAEEGKFVIDGNEIPGNLALGLADFAISAEWEKKKDDPAAAMGMLQVRSRLADVKLAAGEAAGALALYDDILDKVTRTQAPSLVLDAMRAQIAHKRGEALEALDRNADARGAFKEAAEMNKALAAKDAKNTDFAIDRALALGRRAELIKDRAAAEKLWREALTITAEPPAGPDRRRWRVHQARLHADLGFSLLARKKKRAGLEELRRGASAFEGLENDAPLGKVDAVRLEQIRGALGD